MKKFFYFPIFVIMIVVLAVACKKDTSCGALIRVYFSENGQDAEEPATDALVQIGTNANYAEFAKAEGYTNSDGIFEWTFKYEASLDIVVTTTRPFFINDSTMVDMPYKGTSQVKLEPGETVEVTVLVLPE
ncbi:MAG: hypothetical protein J6W84_07515 [Bacteroidales bacterium]|nr:hypothetical protein [Bacteroidales bacterium]MBQ7489457.1 hypothetical protein [Bacteroidales bacterium]